MPPELLSMGIGAFTGFLFKYLAVQSQDRKDTLDLLLKKTAALDESANQASKRSSDSAGRWIRRFLVVSLMCGLIFFPMILTLLHEHTIVEIESPKKTLLGLFNWGGVTKYYSLDGFLVSQTLRCSILALISYYFGNASAQKD